MKKRNKGECPPTDRIQKQDIEELDKMNEEETIPKEV